MQQQLAGVQATQEQQAACMRNMPRRMWNLVHAEAQLVPLEREVPVGAGQFAQGGTSRHMPASGPLHFGPCP